MIVESPGAGCLFRRQVSLHWNRLVEGLEINLVRPIHDTDTGSQPAFVAEIFFGVGVASLQAVTRDRAACADNHQDLQVVQAVRAILEVIQVPGSTKPKVSKVRATARFPSHRGRGANR